MALNSGLCPLDAIPHGPGSSYARHTLFLPRPPHTRLPAVPLLVATYFSRTSSVAIAYPPPHTPTSAHCACGSCCAIPPLYIIHHYHRSTASRFTYSSRPAHVCCCYARVRRALLPRTTTVSVMQKYSVFSIQYDHCCNRSVAAPNTLLSASHCRCYVSVLLRVRMCLPLGQLLCTYFPTRRPSCEAGFVCRHFARSTRMSTAPRRQYSM